MATSRASDRDLLRIFPVAIVAIAVLLALALRSLVAPLCLIASVALSYLTAFGLSVLLFQDANGGGLPYFVPFLFLFLLALGEDYNILVMARIREEAGDIPLRQAVPRALERTGSTVSSAGLVLAGTFGVFAVVVGMQPGGGVYRDLLPPRDRYPDGRLPGAHAAGPLDGRAARSLELVAVVARQAGRGRARTNCHPH